ncbi:MAG: hypothetical protein RLN75_03420 [Longimicrobiales bacterium]
MIPFRTTALGVLSLAALAGCQDLDVVNTNQPDADRALANPSDVESLVVSAWNPYWSRTHTSASSVNAMPVVADEMTATYANNSALELSSEPRIALNNNPTATASGIPRFQWDDWYLALSNANDGLRAIADGLVIIDDSGDDRTHATRVWAKHMQGVALGYVGLIFDQGYIVKEDTDLGALELRPYTEVVEAAVASLEEAVQLAQSGADFTLAGDVLNGVPVTRDLIVQLSNAYIARFMVLAARTPEERELVDWSKVLQVTAAGIVEDHVTLQEDGIRESTLYFRAANDGSFQQRADYKHIGWADVSGAFQEWLNTPIPDREKFLITTPDRRITGETPESDGKYFEHLTVERFRPERGTYHFSWYQWNIGQTPDVGDRFWENGPAVLYHLEEQNLYRAEAMLRTGNAAGAAEIINQTRVANGELPPVTAAGVPQSDDCVPRRADGSCGDLEWALYYERMIELTGTDALRAWMDKRGFGQLTEGTFVHMPIPGRELANTNLAIYTFGGVGGIGAASGGEAG